MLIACALNLKIIKKLSIKLLRVGFYQKNNEGNSLFVVSVIQFLITLGNLWSRLWRKPLATDCFFWDLICFDAIELEYEWTSFSLYTCMYLFTEFSKLRLESLGSQYPKIPNMLFILKKNSWETSASHEKLRKIHVFTAVFFSFKCSSENSRDYLLLKLFKYTQKTFLKASLKDINRKQELHRI